MAAGLVENVERGHTQGGQPSPSGVPALGNSVAVLQAVMQTNRRWGLNINMPTWRKFMSAQASWWQREILRIPPAVGLGGMSLALCSFPSLGQLKLSGKRLIESTCPHLAPLHPRPYQQLLASQLVRSHPPDPVRCPSCTSSARHKCQAHGFVPVLPTPIQGTPQLPQLRQTLWTLSLYIGKCSSGQTKRHLLEQCRSRSYASS